MSNSLCEHGRIPECLPSTVNNLLQYISPQKRCQHWWRHLLVQNDLRSALDRADMTHASLFSFVNDIVT